MESFGNPNGALSVQCTNCPDFFAIEKPEPKLYDSENMCSHIVDWLENRADAVSIGSDSALNVFATKLGPVLTGDEFFSVVEVEVGFSQRGGAREVTGQYTPEHGSTISIDLGMLMPGEGRHDIALRIEDRIAASEVDKCKSIGTHNPTQQQQFEALIRMDDSIKYANLFCMVMENCCIPCYAKSNAASGYNHPPLQHAVSTMKLQQAAMKKGLANLSGSWLNQVPSNSIVNTLKNSIARGGYNPSLSRDIHRGNGAYDA